MIEGIEVVFFDAAGTLFDVRGSVGHTYAAVAARYGVEADPREVNREFAAAFREQSLRGFEPFAPDLPLAEKQWWFEVVRAVFGRRMSAASLKDYFHEVFEYFRRGEAWELFPETRACLSKLRDSGRRLGVVSNFDSRLVDVLRDLGIDSFFDAVTLSWRAGAPKPNRRIFEAALTAMRAEAGRALHVGDSPDEDFEGAKNAGMRAILLDRFGERDCPDEYCARNLDEVYRMLGPPSRTLGCSRTASSCRAFSIR